MHVWMVGVRLACITRRKACARASRDGNNRYRCKVGYAYVYVCGYAHFLCIHSLMNTSKIIGMNSSHFMSAQNRYEHFYVVRFVIYVAPRGFGGFQHRNDAECLERCQPNTHINMCAFFAECSQQN